MTIFSRGTKTLRENNLGSVTVSSRMFKFDRRMRPTSGPVPKPKPKPKPPKPPPPPQPPPPPPKPIVPDKVKIKPKIVQQPTQYRKNVKSFNNKVILPEFFIQKIVQETTQYRKNPKSSNNKVSLPEFSINPTIL